MTFKNPNPANDPFRQDLQKIRILLDTIKSYGEVHHKDSMTGTVIKYLRLAILQIMAYNFRRKFKSMDIDLPDDFFDKVAAAND